MLPSFLYEKENKKEKLLLKELTIEEYIPYYNVQEEKQNNTDKRGIEIIQL